MCDTNLHNKKLQRNAFWWLKSNDAIVQMCYF